jgi:hypothetical protein
MPDGTIVLIGGSTTNGYLNDVWQSGDQGATWARVNANAGWTPRDSLGIAALSDGSIVVSGGTLAGGYTQFNDVWRSTDKGVTWTEMTPHAKWAARYGHRMAAMPDGSVIITGGYTFGNGYWNDVWRSTDKGATWSRVNPGAAWPGRILHTSVVMHDGSIILMGGQVGSSYANDTWRSADNGVTWTLVTPKAGWDSRFTHTSVVMPDGSIVLMGGWDGREMGDVWRFTLARSTLKNPADSPDKDIPTADTKAPAAGFSVNGNADLSSPWTRLNANAAWTPRAWHSSVVMRDGSIVLIGGMDQYFSRKNDVWRSMDNGTTWMLMNARAGWSARYGQTCVAMPDGSIVLMGGYEHSKVKNDVWRSKDNGATWALVTPGAGWSARFEHSSVVMPDGSILVMGGRDLTNKMNDVWRSTDYGATWTQVTTHAGWSARHSFCSVVMPDSSILLMGGYDSTGRTGVKDDTWRSTDNGATWTQVNAGAWGGRYDFSSVVMPDGVILLMGGADTITRMGDMWQSMDNGATWTRVTTYAGWPARYGQSSVVLPDGSVVLTGGTAYGSDGGDLNDVWRLIPAGFISGDGPGVIRITKESRPISMKQGTDARITITVFNRGLAPVHDVEIVDTTLPEFPVVDGAMQYAVPSIESNDSRIFTYTVHATEPGSFRLPKTKVMYADQEGNYQITFSDYEKVNVLASLIPPTPENEADAVFGDMTDWFNGLDRYLESMITDNSRSL